MRATPFEVPLIWKTLTAAGDNPFMNP